MNYFLAFLLLCVGLAVAKSVAIVLGLALLLFVLITVLRHPRETIGFLVLLGLLGLMNAQPVLCIVAITVLAVVGAVVGRERRPPPALTDGRS